MNYCHYHPNMISKQFRESDYASRFDVDTRGIRLPGLISSGAPPGGGTTDYAVEMFYQAVRYQHYTCFIAADTAIDMMYMPDAVRAIIELMEADAASLTHRNAYNVTATMCLRRG